MNKRRENRESQTDWRSIRQVFVTSPLMGQRTIALKDKSSVDRYQRKRIQNKTNKRRKRKTKPTDQVENEFREKINKILTQTNDNLLIELDHSEIVAILDQFSNRIRLSDIDNFVTERVLVGRDSTIRRIFVVQKLNYSQDVRWRRFHPRQQEKKTTLNQFVSNLFLLVRLFYEGFLSVSTRKKNPIENTDDNAPRPKRRLFAETLEFCSAKGGTALIVF